MRFPSRSPEQTRAAARALAAAVSSDGLVVALVGPLGAGKTAFVKGLAEGLGIDPARVASPSFVVVSEYPAAPRRLAHVDCYRVESAAELEAAGFLDLLEPGALIAVEWADRFWDALPGDRLEITIERGDDPEGRAFAVRASGADSAAALERWRKRLEALVEIEMGS